MHKYILFIILLIVFNSCRQGVIFQSKVDLPEIWTYDNPIQYEYTIKDTTIAYDMVLSLNHQEDYGYENLYVKVKTTFPDKTETENILSFELADKKGIWQGSCDGKECDTEILLSSKAYYRQKGNYVITFEQNSRSDTLRGINSLELSILKAK